MGEKFGREWNLCIHSPAHALKLINANKPGVDAWVRENADVYSHYHIVIEHETGAMEEISEETLSMNANIKSIRFVPLIEGAGNVGRILVGAALVVAAVVLQQYELLPTLASVMLGMGVSMVVGGVIGMLTNTPTTKALGEQGESRVSYFYDGPMNTVGQGDPLALIYGRVLAGSNTIHASQSVEQLM
ncbi:hypothetical protein [Castellaniella sp.]|uniref:hypothetical protein n=1 Tax=Castellaniella sp. TaxID=1955812 RepID=UPI002B0026F5|nr:hypothetical protein [Castellaniella sp.]